MKPIASFTINHNTLVPGFYISRTDGDVVTYDVRFKAPNAGDYLTDGAMHTIEHLFATYMRNTAQADAVIYVGPMGCRTGFYLLMRDTVPPSLARALTREAMEYIRTYEGPVPGATKAACGNYRSHSLPGARRAAAALLAALDRQPEGFSYPD